MQRPQNQSCLFQVVGSHLRQVLAATWRLGEMDSFLKVFSLSFNFSCWKNHLRVPVVKIESLSCIHWHTQSVPLRLLSSSLLSVVESLLLFPSFSYLQLFHLLSVSLTFYKEVS